MRLAVLSMLAVLSGCADEGSNICGHMDKRELIVPTNFDTQKKAASQCVENWAARLSRSTEPATVVAQAALAGCADTLRGLAEYGARENRREEAAWTDRDLRDAALFRAVQWRAGDCKLPEEHNYL